VFKTHRVESGSYFVATWPWANVAEVIGAFQRWAPHASDAMGALCRLATGPSVQVFGQYLGSEDSLKSELAGLTSGLPAPKLTTGTSSWLDLQLRWGGCLGKTPAQCSAFEPSSFAATSAYADAPLSAAGIAALRTAIEQRQGSSGAILLDAYGGAVNRVAPSATAFVHRKDLFSLQFFSAGGADAKAWAHATERAVRPFVSQGAYQNYIDPQLPNWQRAYHGANFARLVAVRKRYDPDRLFRFAQSIP
jgi:FAD/FMN-containing dehydrogenase